MHTMHVNSMFNILFLYMHVYTEYIHARNCIYILYVIDCCVYFSRVYRSVAAVVVNSSQWAVALRYTAPGDKTTPFRELIRKMPSM